MAATSFLGDLLLSITERGRELIGLPRSATQRPGAAELVQLCENLLSRRGEASGVALARLVLDGYATLDAAGREAFLRRVALGLAADATAVETALQAYRTSPTRGALRRLHAATEPRSQELVRRLNLAREGTLALVRMREDLLRLRERLRGEDFADPELVEATDALDADFAHLFASWFNRGFLILRRIDWTSPAHVLEKIIRYEAVHAISDWEDLRRRIEPPDRRCFAFFHPALGDEPLIFVEVALTDTIPAAIGPILAGGRPGPRAPTTAVFYSISNCQRGLAGVTFGSFLIKQVVEDLRRAMPTLKQFVTLSPAPGFRRWLEGERAARTFPTGGAEVLALLDAPGWPTDPARREAVSRALAPLAAAYFLRAKSRDGRPVDPVARFHLGNGARLERLNPMGDLSPKGLAESYGLMVNYLYDLDAIEQNHEAFANQGTVTASPAVTRVVKGEPAEA